jgi:hypothetical protein
MKQYSIDSVLDVMARKRYDVFRRGPFDLNIIGIRSNESRSNSFDDVMAVIYKDEYYVATMDLYPITTDPGKPWLLKPLAGTNGTAILVPGQYRSAYRIGKHGRTHRGGGYTALEQVSEMTYVRDNNRDAVIDFTLYADKAKHFRANLKTNIHRAHPNIIMRTVESYSAGCQVFQNPKHFDEFMKLCQKQVDHGYGQTFTYTLIEERDFSR